MITSNFKQVAFAVRRQHSYTADGLHAIMCDMYVNDDLLKTKSNKVATALAALE